jgi:hypothetical protein
MHDSVYTRELAISNKENGYCNLIALIDLLTFRRIPWENNVPFFLVSALSPDGKVLVTSCRNTNACIWNTHTILKKLALRTSSHLLLM